MMGVIYLPFRFSGTKKQMPSDNCFLFISILSYKQAETSQKHKGGHFVRVPKKQSGAKGAFVVFEGIDCCGKGTQIRLLKKRYPDLFFTEEPYTQEVRDLVEGRAPKPPGGAIAIQSCFVADRQLHLQDEVIPHLLRGQGVLSDRYAYSTFAYGMAYGCTFEQILSLHTQVIGDDMIWPDLTIVLDITAKEAIERLGRRPDPSPQLFEKEPVLQRVREHYHWLADHHERLGIGKIVLLPVSGISLEMTALQVDLQLQQLLGSA